MSQVLTVPTHFTDIGELSEGFLDRVEQDTLILYGPVAYEDGSEIEFSILLADGSPALEGMGRVRAAVDGGDDRVPETRYDVVIEALEFAGMYEVVFERLVIERQAVSEPPLDPAEDVTTGETGVVPAAEEQAVEEEPALAEEDFEAAEEESDVQVRTEELSDGEVLPLAASEDDDEPELTLEASSEELSDEASDEEPYGEDRSAEASYAEASYEEEEYAEAEDAYSEAYDAAYAEAEADVDTGAVAYADTGTDTGAAIDPAYAFEHGIAAEPQVGMPVPIPSMAAPPEAPPAPPSLRLADSPEGLTRPSMAQPEEPVFADDEVSDVHTTGLFAYEEGLPIPSRPPKPDPNKPQRVGTVEAANDYDVEGSEPPQADEDEYEEVRLSDFAEEG